MHTTRNLEDIRRLLTALCCGNSSLADDIAQDSLLKAYISIDSLRDESNFRSWIMRIAYTTFLNNKRAHQINENVEAAISLASTEATDSSFKYQELYEALNRLTPTERTSVALYYLEGYSIKEVASIIGSKPDAVKQHIYRGRTHLRNLLEKRL